MTRPKSLLRLLSLSILCAGGFASCGVDRWEAYAPQTALDSWMYNTMQEHYLWYGSLPDYNTLNLFLEPTAFLSKVRNTADAYSYADTLPATPLPGYGFDYTLVRNPDIDTAYNALVTYVIPHSPAASVLKRGDWIVKVDTSYISRKYEQQLLQGREPLRLTLGSYRQVLASEDGETEGTYRVVANEETVTLGAAAPLVDTPLHTSKILSLTDGSEVGYLMYNAFLAGTDEEPELYNDQLRAWSADLAERGVRNVILDMRYNAGGSMECVQLLGTLLVSSYYLDQSMASLVYNDKNTHRNKTLTFDSALPGTSGRNLNLQTLVVLTSGSTAGAPEMLMHCLNGKIPRLIAIGSNTKGQSVATERFTNEELRWAFYPVVCTVYNAAGETHTGFSPTYSVNTSTDYLHFLPFGNEQETLLSTALSVLNGTYSTTASSPAVVERPVRIESGNERVGLATRRFRGGSGLVVGR